MEFTNSDDDSMLALLVSQTTGTNRYRDRYARRRPG